MTERGILEELGLVSDVALAEWNGGVIEFLAGELGTAAMHLEIASRAFEGRGERADRPEPGSHWRRPTMRSADSRTPWPGPNSLSGPVRPMTWRSWSGRLLRARLVARRGWLEDAEGRDERL